MRGFLPYRWTLPSSSSTPSLKATLRELISNTSDVSPGHRGSLIALPGGRGG